jgi:hypothetical protein
MLVPKRFYMKMETDLASETFEIVEDNKSLENLVILNVKFVLFIIYELSPMNRQ